jgi:hypothetical protein
MLFPNMYLYCWICLLKRYCSKVWRFANRHRQSVLRGKALAKEGGYHLNQAYFYIDKVNMHVNFAGVMREIIFYETASGQKPIEKFIDQLSAKQAQKTPKADIEIAEDRKNDYFRRKMK